MVVDQVNQGGNGSPSVIDPGLTSQGGGGGGGPNSGTTGGSEPTLVALNKMEGNKVTGTGPIILVEQVKRWWRWWRR